MATLILIDYGAEGLRDSFLLPLGEGVPHRSLVEGRQAGNLVELDLNEGGTRHERVYRKFGKVQLTDKDWTLIDDGDEADFNFFKVSVEMK